MSRLTRSQRIAAKNKAMDARSVQAEMRKSRGPGGAVGAAGRANYLEDKAFTESGGKSAMMDDATRMQRITEAEAAAGAADAQLLASLPPNATPAQIEAIRARQDANKSVAGDMFREDVQGAQAAKERITQTGLDVAQAKRDKVGDAVQTASNVAGLALDVAGLGPAKQAAKAMMTLAQRGGDDLDPNERQG